MQDPTPRLCWQNTSLGALLLHSNYSLLKGKKPTPTNKWFEDKKLIQGAGYLLSWWLSLLTLMTRDVSFLRVSFHLHHSTPPDPHIPAAYTLPDRKPLKPRSILLVTILHIYRLWGIWLCPICPRFSLLSLLGIFIIRNCYQRYSVMGNGSASRHQKEKRIESHPQTHFLVCVVVTIGAIAL